MKLETVMVVDDSEPDQFLAKLTLNKFDPSINVIQAYDGLEALKYLGKLDSPPEVIFLDINMPRMDGHEFLKEYAKAGFESTVVVMLTSSDQERDREQTEFYDYVLDHFPKPLSREQLEQLEHLVQSRS
tara:strand:+ start:72 stop:458 length:387 start_codon:yes stop_codon:yes gene_type:complete